MKSKCCGKPLKRLTEDGVREHWWQCQECGKEYSQVMKSLVVVVDLNPGVSREEFEALIEDHGRVR